MSQKKQYAKMVEFTAEALRNKAMRNITVTDMQAICNRLSVYSASHVTKYMSMVRGAVSFAEGNQPKLTDGKTDAAQRTIPMVPPLADALRGHHGLLCTKVDGTLMTQAAFDRKFDSYKTFLEEKLNGCRKRWYGKTKDHKALIAAGKELPPWKDVTIRCHDFRVDFCTRCYYAGIPLKTLQNWMGHSDAQMILEIYSKLTKEQEANDAIKLANLMTASSTHVSA